MSKKRLNSKIGDVHTGPPLSFHLPSHQGPVHSLNVVLNVNMFLIIRSIKSPFGFDLISKNVSTILGIKRIQTITW